MVQIRLYDLSKPYLYQASKKMFPGIWMKTVICFADVMGGEEITNVALNLAVSKGKNLAYENFSRKLAQKVWQATWTACIVQEIMSKCFYFILF